MLMTFIKIFMMIFPFVKEIFVGDAEPPSRRNKSPPTPVKSKLIKQALVGLGVASFVACLFLAKQLWTVSSDYYKLLESIQKPVKVETPPVIQPPPDIVSTPPEETTPPSVPASAVVIMPRKRKKQPKSHPQEQADLIHHNDIIKKLQEIEKCATCN